MSNVDKIVSYTCSLKGSKRVATLVTTDGNIHEVDETDPRFHIIVDAVAEDNWHMVYEGFTRTERKKLVGAVVEAPTSKETTTKTDTESMHTLTVHSAIEKLMHENIDVRSLKNFADKIGQNPVEHVRDHLFAFISHHNIAICDDGDFLCVKAVRPDYMDCYTGNTFRNMPGDTPSVSWDDVDIDPDRACSRGLHVCAPHYLSWFASNNRRVMLVKQNPADIGSIPHKYDEYSKIRGVRYEVIADITEEFSHTRPLSDFLHLIK